MDGTSLRRHRRAGFLFVSLALALAAPVRAQAGGRLQTSAGFLRDDNPGQALEAGDRVAVTGAWADLGLAVPNYFTDTFSLRVSGRIRAEAFRQVPDLDQVTIGAEVDLHRKWGLGRLAPWTELGWASSREAVRQGLRSAWVHRASLRAGKRLAEPVDAGLEIWTERRTAAADAPWVAGLPGDAFSRSSRGVSGSLEWHPQGPVYLGVGWTWRQGDMTVASPDGIDEYPQARAACLDPTFGPGFHAYRFEGTGQGGRVRALWLVGDRTALAAAFERQVSHVDGGETYIRDISSLSVQVRF